jgi:hypothetical protein
MSIFLTSMVAAMILTPNSTTQTKITEELVALEHVALDGWIQGNPDPNFALFSKDITYFDSGVGKLLDGLPAIKAYFDQYRGKPLYDSYEIKNPKVQGSQEIAVLTYRLVIHNGTTETPFHCTEVYRKQGKQWRLIHSLFTKEQ